jgi:hypothetical protein
MKKIILIAAGLSAVAMAYERSSMPNLMTPSELEAKQMVVGISHRFFGPVDDKPLKTFLGMDQGVYQVVLGLRFHLGRGFELKTTRRIRFPKEFTLGLSYVHAVSGLPLKAQLDFHTISELKQFNSDNRESNWFGLLSVQTNPLMKRIYPVLNIGYDHRAEFTGAGAGLSIEVIKWMHVQAEFGITSNNDEGFTGKSVSFGVKLLTFGHHFLLFVGNNQTAGPQAMMRGTRPVIINGKEENKLYFGFNIFRIFEF